MASNQDRYFTTNPVIGDSSKLRFSQSCNGFNVNLFNAAAKSDKLLTNFIQSLQLRAEALRVTDKKLSIAPLLLLAKTDFPILRPRTMRLQPSPNAPNTLPAFSLAAA
jgi:hypothetical protein